MYIKSFSALFKRSVMTSVGRLTVLPVVVLSSLLTGPIAASAQSTGVTACIGADSGTNTVIHFYLAIDRRQFAAAYACLAPAEAARNPFKQWKKTFAHTFGARLVLADDEVKNGVPATHVAIDVHLIDRVKGKMTLTSYQGMWHLNSQHLLVNPKLTPAYRDPIKSIPPTSPKTVFTVRKLRVLKHRSVDLTGDGVADDIYFTTLASCRSACHSQQIWIYSQNKLIYQQEVDDGQIIPWRNHLAMQIRTDTPGSQGFDTGSPTERTYVTWFWTDWGFVLHDRKIVPVTH
jgi:hypothetical protein